MMTMTKRTPCPSCGSALVQKYVNDASGEVIGANFFCVTGDWQDVTNW
jgi:hypothetical protein